MNPILFLLNILVNLKNSIRETFMFLLRKNNIYKYMFLFLPHIKMWNRKMECKYN